jgi:hypothetical protein
MEFELITNSTLRKILLNFLNPVRSTYEDEKKEKKGQIISNQIGESAFNQSQPTTLRQIKPLPTNQSAFYIFNNTTPY